MATMALHCAATLLLVGEDRVDVADEPGLAAVYGPWSAAVDVVGELQHLADQHRGERVLVRLGPGDLATVRSHLGRDAARDSGADGIRVEVGDDGWAVLPWDGG